MPDLPQRTQKENEIARRLNGLFRGSKKGLIALLGDPPDVRNVPADHWERMKQEAHDRLASILIIIFMLASRNLARGFGFVLGAAAIQSQAGIWAGARAENAGKMVDGVRDRLAGFDGRVMPKSRIKALVGDAFARADLQRLAATETTAGISAGEKTVVDLLRTQGRILTATWYTEADGRVCPICAPLHARPEEEWPAGMREGPPAHPRCRCWLLYDETGGKRF